MGANVKNGTPMHGPPLCDSCVNAHIERGYRESEALVICQATSPEHRVQFRVRECSGYVERNRQNLWQMQTIAWLLMPRKGKRVEGFIPPRELHEDECNVEIELDKSK